MTTTNQSTKALLLTTALVLFGVAIAGMVAGQAPDATDAGADCTAPTLDDKCEVWEATKDDGCSVYCPMAVSPDGEHIYIGTPPGGADLSVDALDADTGDFVWTGSNEGSSMGDAEDLVVSADGDYVVAFGNTKWMDENHILTVAFDADTGEQRWSSVHETAKGDAGRSGAIGPHSERVFVTGASATIAYELETGDELWSVDSDSANIGFSGGAWDVLADPEGENVYVTVEESPHRAVAYNATTGELQWEAGVDDTTPEFIYSNSISPDGRTLIFAGGDPFSSGYAAALDTEEGGLLWRADLKFVTGSPYATAGTSAVSPDSQTVYVQGNDHREGDPAGGDAYILSFETRTGDHRWTKTEPGQHSSGLDSLAVGTDSSAVYAGFTSNMGPGMGASYAVHSDLVTLSLDAETGEKRWRATYNVDDAQAGAHWPAEVLTSPDGSHVYVGAWMRSYSEIVLGGETPLALAYETGNPDTPLGAGIDPLSAATSANPQDGLETQSANEALAKDLLHGFGATVTADHDRALEAARTVMDHRGTSVSDPEPDVSPMLERQQANLNLSEQILSMAGDPVRQPWQQAVNIAEFGILDRLRMTENGDLVEENVATQLDQARSTLDTTRLMLDIIGDSHDTPLAESIELAKEAARHQADTLDLDLTTPPGPNHATPSQAATTLVDRFDGASLRSEDVDRLDQLPEPTRTALTDLIDAFLRYEHATTDAYALADFTSFQEKRTLWEDPRSIPGQEVASPLTSEASPPFQEGPDVQTSNPNMQPEPLQGLEEVGVDLGSILPARNALMDASLVFAEALDENEASGSSLDQLRAPPALAIDLTKTDNIYDQDYALLIDAGGSDRYDNNAGGSNLLGEHEGDCRGNETQAAALVDLGLGDDDYTTPGRNCGVRGGGYLGAGLLIDEGGNDTFESYTTGITSDAGPSLLSSDIETASTPTDDNDTSSNRYVVGVQSAPDKDPGDRLHGAPIVETSETLRFLVVEPNDPGAFLEEAREDADVRYVEEDVTVQLHSEPNDPLFEAQYGPPQINAPEAWDTSFGDASRSVCVVDTGVDYRHPDLNSSRWLGGTDFGEDDSDPFDAFGHGTHVAGIAAATIDNEEGIAGVGNVSLQAAKVFDDNGFGYATDVARGIEWCADNDGDVISVSIGHGDVTAVQEAVEHAWNAGSLIVASAGNDGCFECLAYPAAYEAVIAVTCTDADTDLCGFSSYGPGAELAAPGHEVLSTLSETRGGGYDERSGTSMSAPHVSGVAALVWSQVSDLSNDELRQLLRGSGSDIGPPGCDEKFGHGLVDAGATLKAALDGDRPSFEGPTECLSGGYFGTNGGALGGVGLLVAAGEGDDTFQAGGLGANGGAVGGLGGLVNGGGSDRFEALGVGTNGGGASGSGLLVDASEKDTIFIAREGGTNGGADDSGHGLLLAKGGSNTFQASHFGTNGGGFGFGVGSLIDAGKEDTTYQATYVGTNGGGASIFSVGLLLDAGGDDTYNATSYGTNGGGYVQSAGLLVDTAGNDTYTAEELATNGGAFLASSGFLADTGGHDTYNGTQKGVNGGGFGQGAGFLLDAAGDNTYQAGRAATNGGGSSSAYYYGGSGFLFDAGTGETVYEATDIATNGGALYRATGLLLDADGDNIYRATHSATNGGAAAPESYGTLIDAGTGTSTYEATSQGTNGGAYNYGEALLVNAGGDNTYRATASGTNGGSAFKTGSGFLLDARGNDTYNATSYGTNGGTFSEGSGFLLDAAGDDAYKADECGTNGGADAECLPPLAVANPSTHGLLLDGGGTDAYEDALSECTDCTHAPKGGAGAQVDASGGLLWEAIQG